MGTMRDRLEQLALADAMAVVQKNREYGESWCQRGGGQAFSVIWRKSDRIISMLEKQNERDGFPVYDLFKLWRENIGDPIDDIRDLRRYLLLLEEYMRREEMEAEEQSLMDQLGGMRDAAR